MNRKDSMFGAEPDRLRQLIRSGMDVDDEDIEDNLPARESISGLMMERAGILIGCYKLLRVLGEGGMGMVYLAEQEQLIRRRVALKIIKPGMDSKRVLARFEAERQALALLDHPSIAQVYDAGTADSGRPYFVMEYVKGSTITEFCDRHTLSIDERLRLFQQVCLALQHAHQKGIIHRDIKPSNILVSSENDQAMPKIIDFGVAKAVSQPLTDRTLVTEENQLLGTPEYMSPEQAEFANEDIDTRSDIYSLGVLLYELLTGVLPFDSKELRERGIEHIRKIIRETDPRTPSTRLTKLGDEARKIAENRRTEIVVLAKCLHRELEWIPLKAMRKERSERYRSASELADDVENYVTGAPLLAGPLTAGYRLRKFMRRNKGAFVSVVTVAAALVIGLAISAISLVRVQRARRIAVVSQKKEVGLRQQAQANEVAMRQIAYASDMSLAQQALAMNDMGRARRLLEDQRPIPGKVDLRGWEWRYLWLECRRDNLGELCRYSPSPCSVTYSADGRTLAIAGTSRDFVEIWDVPGHKRIANLQPKEGHLVAFSPHGDLLATDTGDQIQFLGTGSWDLVHQLTVRGSVLVLKFSRDGRRFASLSFPDELTVWDVDQWAVICQIRGVKLKWWFGDLDFSPDGEALVFGDADGHLQRVDLASSNMVFKVSEAHPEAITSVAWSPNGSVIATGSGWLGGPIRLWDAASGKAIGAMEGHTLWISELVFSKNGLRLYSASGDQTIRIWDVEQRRCQSILGYSSHEVLGLALSPDGTTLTSACKDGTIAFWSATPRPKEEFPRLIPLSEFSWPAFTPDGQVLAVPRAGAVSLFDLTTSNEIEQIPALGNNDIRRMAYSPDGTFLVGGSKDGKIHVWSCAERRLLHELDGHQRSVFLLHFRADGTRLLSIDVSGKAIWWHVPAWHAGQSFSVKLFHREGIVSSPPVGVSPDGRLLVTGAVGALNWLNAETGEFLAKTAYADPGNMTQVAFSGDGSKVASVSYYGTVALWDSSSFKLIIAFRGHLLGAHGVSFSPDGRRLATGGGTSRDAIKLWDLSTHRELITLAGQSSVFTSVVFSSDGGWVSACSRDEGKLHLWRAPSWKEIEVEEMRLERGKSP
jgi:eukaryotic-like serine/threonine-protein kinase